MATLFWNMARDLFLAASDASVDVWHQSRDGKDSDLDFTRREADSWLVLAACLKAMCNGNLPRREREDYVYWMDSTQRMFDLLETIRPKPSDNERRKANIQAIQEAVAIFRGTT